MNILTKPTRIVTPKEYVTVYMDSTLVEQLNRICEEVGVNRSEAIRQLVTNYIESQSNTESTKVS